MKAGAENVEASAIAIADEPNANAFVAMLQQYGINVPGWKYADGTLPSTDEVAEAPQLPMAGMASYTIKCVDQDGNPSMDLRYNPNGSVLAIEGITSPDGRVFGKMGHSERSGEYLYKNVTGDKYQPIFEGGVDYFKV